MNIIKGIDRIALVLAIIATIPGMIAYCAVFGSPLEWSEFATMFIVGSSVAFLIVLFTIRGLARISLWFVNMFKRKTMKERLLGVMKWGLILVIAGMVFYVVCPKYYFSGPRGIIMYRCNKITGYVEQMYKGEWTSYTEVLNQKRDK